jgi:hypothetical protein
MSPARYDVMRDDVKEALEDLWTRGTERARHRLAFELKSSLDHETQGSVVSDALARSILGITAALAGWSIGRLHSTWLAILVTLAVAVVAVTPDVKRLYAAVVAPRYVIDLKGEG